MRSRCVCLVPTLVTRELKDAVVSASLEGLAANCTASWSCTQNHAPHKAGNGTAVLTFAGSGVSVGVAVLSDYLLAGGAGAAALLPVGLNLTDCAARINATGLKFLGGSPLADELNAKEQQLTAALSGAVSAEVCPLLAKLVQQNASAALRSLSAQMLDFMAGNVDLPVAPPVPRGCDPLPTSAAINAADYVLDDVIGVNGTNTIVNVATNNTGVAHFALSAAETAVVFPNVGSATLLVSDGAVSGLNAWSSLSLLEPVSDFELSSWAYLAEGAGTSFTLVTNFSSPAAGQGSLFDPLWLYEEWALSLTLGESRFGALLQLALESARGRNYTDAQCRDPQCLVALVDWSATALTNLTVLLEGVTVRLEAASGALDADSDVRRAVEDAAAVLLGAYAPALPQLAAGIAAGPGASTVNEWLGALGGGISCPFKKDAEETYERVNFRVGAYCAAGSVLALTALTCASAAINRFRNGKSSAMVSNDKELPTNEEESSPKASPNLQGNLAEINFRDLLDEEEVEPLLAAVFKDIQLKGRVRELLTAPDEQACLLLHPLLPALVRFLVPALVLATVSVYVVFEVGKDFGGRLSVTAGTGREVAFKPIVSKHSKLWLPGAPAVSMLVSGSHVWIYLAQLLLLVLWFLPGRILSPQRRSACLLFLVVTAACVLPTPVMEATLIACGAFHFRFPVHDAVAHAIASPLALDLRTVPLPGMPCLFAGLLCCVPVAVLAFCVNEFAARNSNSSTVLSSSSSSRVVLGHAWLPVAMLAALLCLCTAAFVPFVYVRVSGLAGWLEDSTGEANGRDYSLAGIFDALEQSSPGAAAARVPRLALYALTLAAPSCCAACLVALWVVPLTQRKARCLAVTALALFSYSASLVASFTAAVTAAGLDKLAQGLVGSACSPINDVLARYTGAEGAACIGLEPRVHWPACCALVGSAASFELLCGAMLLIAKRRLDQRD
eukprot:TRINITY_DN19_c3_g1_i3.p1 TRINITY_DN19_c3_g1~~TRINITY_DN19_c3_g1_i3.p1  ORF type:complete len:957 (-),score=228.08 TRINITY_DN19_c3_g1_i3:8-2878(-)